MVGEYPVARAPFNHLTTLAGIRRTRNVLGQFPCHRYVACNNGGFTPKIYVIYIIQEISIKNLTANQKWFSELYLVSQTTSRVWALLVCVACSRLRDSGEKSFSKKKCEKRAGAGERQTSHFSRRHRALSQVASVLFSLCSF